MATSESDDFESADEEMNHDIQAKRSTQRPRWQLPNTIDSESDDDTEYLPRVLNTNANTIYSSSTGNYYPETNRALIERTPDIDIANKNTHNYDKKERQVDNVNTTEEGVNASTSVEQAECVQVDSNPVHLKETDINVATTYDKEMPSEKSDLKPYLKTSILKPNEGSRSQKQQKLGAKKLGTKIITSSNITECTDNVATEADKGNTSMIQESTLFKTSSIKEEINDAEMPEEMKSNKKFKEVFKPQGWEGLGNEIELPEELTEEKLKPILKKLSLGGKETETASAGWGWTNWGVSSLINTASFGVSTLSSHVSHGLTLLEESMAITDEPKSITNTGENHSIDDDKKEEPKEESPFGFGNLISGVSSITKLVESTGSKVVSGGLDTLEAIGKKTMEMLQEGDPGLKKKRALFISETDKPNLSQILREAKEKAEIIEKTFEEKQKMRKVHFESLFDDYQGLVHLEALEMLSKQSNIKIQQHLISLDTNELSSIQKMLEEVEELCELTDDDENEDTTVEKDLKLRLQEACNDLGISISYEKLYEVYEESTNYTALHVTDDQEIFEQAISCLAQFTAFSVERFHKSAELLLIKERRSIVNESDSLVQLTNILSKHVRELANTYCSCLNELIEITQKSDALNANITTIFMEASNASSYIQDAFKLLIPIIQVGAL